MHWKKSFDIVSQFDSFQRYDIFTLGTCNIFYVMALLYHLVHINEIKTKSNGFTSGVISLGMFTQRFINILMYFHNGYCKYCSNKVNNEIIILMIFFIL